jgi:polyisoprenoid-binding protein YceI
VTFDKDSAWTLGPADGELLLHTGVAGRAARMGHRLTIAMTRWRATVRWADSRPISAELVVETNSLEVLRGDGGVKGLSGAEKALVRSNALKSLSAHKFPLVRYIADAIEEADDGYRLTGELQIRGRSRHHEIDLHAEDVGDSWRMSVDSTIRQSDYGIKPYSLLMGSVQVADEVSLTFSAVRAQGN